MSILKPTATGLEVTGNATLEITSNINAVDPTDSITGTISRSVGTDGVSAMDVIDAFGSFAHHILRRSNGTNAAKTAIVAGDIIGIWSSRGYGATGYSTSGRAQFRHVATENWTDSAQGALVEIHTTANGATSSVAVSRYGDTGIRSSNVGSAVASAGTITPTGPVFHVTGVAAIGTINVPSNSLASPVITIIPDGIFTWTAAGNIALAGTAVVSKAIIFTYDSGTSKWYPSYV